MEAIAELRERSSLSVKAGGFADLIGGEASGSEHTGPLKVGSHSGLGDVESDGQLLLGGSSLVGNDQLVNALRAQAVPRRTSPGLVGVLPLGETDR